MKVVMGIPEEHKPVTYEDIGKAISWTITEHGFESISNDNEDLNELIQYYNEHKG